MATYNPTEEMLKRQIDSIRAQDYDNWVCVIQDDWSNEESYRTLLRVVGDDPRFKVERSSRNVGFYHNFERVLSRVPADCDLVCLSDQDDFWHADKLSVLVGAFGERTTLVYSDMRIVEDSGSVLANSYWISRANNHTDLETLFFTNTVTGAASMFRASLLPLILPFPPKIGVIYHDWWIAIIALAAGEIGYIDRPLYDYYQHAGNVIGWCHIPRPASIRAFVTNGAFRREAALAAVHLYTHEYKYQVMAAMLLRIRVPVSRHDAAIARINGVNRHPLGTLIGQCLRARFTARVRVSRMREKNVLMAWILYRLINLYFQRRQQQIIQAFPSAEEAAQQEPDHLATQHIAPVDNFERKFRPVTLDVLASEPRRVNIVLERVDFQYIYGGYIGMFQFARHIAAAGFKVRIVIVERTEFEPDVWREKIQKYQGLEDLLDRVEFSYHFDRAHHLPVNPRDYFIATNCWNASIAEAATRQLHRERFAFLIQEFEPYFSAHGSHYAFTSAAYNKNMFGVFSTEILRNFFRENRIGLYRDGRESGDSNSMSFSNAVIKSDVDAARLRRPAGAKRKLLFSCRPEAHAQRNLYEMGVAALRHAIRHGALSPKEWEFFGVGSLGERFAIPLEAGGELVAIPKMTLKEYASYLPDFDLGMSLMYTPHPSLVPLEMAGAGMITVTNSYANKTAEVLRSISTNFETGEASIEDLADALKRAESRVGDIEGRVRGAAIHWPTSWDEALSPSALAPLLAELSRGQAAPVATG